MVIKQEECKHINTSFVRISYVRGNCEHTLRCKDCDKVLDYYTNTFIVKPVLV